MTGYMPILSKVESGMTNRNRKGMKTLTSRRFKRLIGNLMPGRLKSHGTTREERKTAGEPSQMKGI